LETVQHSNFDDIPDSFFELTVNDVKKLYYEMKQDVEAMNNQPLRTSELRMAEEQQKRQTVVTQYKQAILRVQLPERFVLQGTFLPEEKVEDVKRFVRSHLKDPTLDFHLFCTPPKRVLDPASDLIEAGCVPQALVHFGTDVSESRYLKEELYEKVSTAAAAASSVVKLRGGDHSAEQMSTDDATASGSGSTSGQQPRVPTNFMKSKAGASEAKVPKWFKTGK
jgi:tether containing UBX domain for GLUT4